MTRDKDDNGWLHPDQHALVTVPGQPLQFIAGDDGGVVRSNGQYAVVQDWGSAPGVYDVLSLRNGQTRVIVTKPMPQGDYDSIRVTFAGATETGASATDTVVFLHGNPTSSYLWRNVLPIVATKARCLAPDLIGFGESARPNALFGAADYGRTLAEFIRATCWEEMPVLIGSGLGSFSNLRSTGLPTCVIR